MKKFECLDDGKEDLLMRHKKERGDLRDFKRVALIPSSYLLTRKNQ